MSRQDTCGCGLDLRQGDFYILLFATFPLVHRSILHLKGSPPSLLWMMTYGNFRGMGISFSWETLMLEQPIPIRYFMIPQTICSKRWTYHIWGSSDRQMTKNIQSMGDISWRRWLCTVWLYLMVWNASLCLGVSHVFRTDMGPIQWIMWWHHRALYLASTILRWNPDQWA